MTPEDAIKSALAAIRVNAYPAEALKTAAAPFVFYLQMTWEDEDALDGPTGLLSAAFEINCVAATYAGLVGLCADVLPTLRSLQGRHFERLLIEQADVRQASPDLKEKETNLFRRMYILQIYYQEE